jgi:hypothetical protein
MPKSSSTSLSKSDLGTLFKANKRLSMNSSISVIENSNGLELIILLKLSGKSRESVKRKSRYPGYQDPIVKPDNP